MLNKERLDKPNDINNELEQEWVEYYLNKSLSHEYNPVVSDDIISLSVPSIKESQTINGCLSKNLDIILNKTKTLLGCIGFNYYYDEKDKFNVGNVTYVIDKKYQNRGYATRALKLLIDLLKNNEFEGDKDLYFWVSYYNNFSKKVILNNGGEIIKGGQPPTNIKAGTPYVLRIKI